MLKDKLLTYISDKNYTPKTLSELGEVLGVLSENYDTLENAVKELFENGKLFETPKHKFAKPSQLGLIYGQLDMSKNSYGFIRQDDTEDYFVPKGRLLNALDGDWVYALPIKRAGDKKGAEIVKVAKTSIRKIIGTLVFDARGAVVMCDSEKIKLPIYIDDADLNGATYNSKVSVEIVKLHKNRQYAIGKVVAVLGDADDTQMPIIKALYENDIPTEFKKKTLKQADSVENTVPKSEYKFRLDLRDKMIFTIDGDDSKDFDDAVSIEKSDNGNYILGVHIADVSHYVTENSPLDKEAYLRGTSTYLADRVIPMLPEKLSNGICSLNPRVVRLALSVIMEIDSNGGVVDYWINKSIIKSKYRMTYKIVTQLLENPTDELVKKYAPLLDDIKLMKTLSEILFKKRERRGAVNFEFPESYIKVDENGKAIGVEKREITLSNHIIEEFMLVCNETVAEHLCKNKLPGVYRVHEAPAPDKIEGFREFIRSFGYSLDFKGEEIEPKAYQLLCEKIKETDNERIIQTMMLRSMMKANYSSSNKGHFGLAAEYYCHFTSPIRRYPDLVVHRILSESLAGEIGDKRTGFLTGFCDGAAKQSSDREIAAMQAERTVEDIKKAEYMSQFIGDNFEGVITSVTSFGMFVELDNTIEGLVRVSDLQTDYYEFNEKTMSLVGKRNGFTYKIGDKVTVRLINTSVSQGQIDFVIPDEYHLKRQNMSDFFIDKSKAKVYKSNKKERFDFKEKKRKKSRKGRYNHKSDNTSGGRHGRKGKKHKKNNSSK